MSWDLSAHAGARRAWGLLLSRLGLMLTLVQLALLAGPACPAGAWWLLSALGLGLVAGLLSCACAAASLLWLLWLVWVVGLLSPAMPGAAWPLAASAVAQAAVVMLLGAGRWSVDRRLFGRRLVFESDDTFG